MLPPKTQVRKGEKGGREGGKRGVMYSDRNQGTGPDTKGGKKGGKQEGFPQPPIPSPANPSATPKKRTATVATATAITSTSAAGTAATTPPPATPPTRAIKEKKEDKEGVGGGPKKFHYLGEQKKLVRTYARFTLGLGANWSRDLREVVSARGVALSDLSLSDWSQSELDALYQYWSVESPGMEALREHWVGEKRLQDPSVGTSIGTSVATSGGSGGGRWGGQTAAAAATTTATAYAVDPSFVPPLSPSSSSCTHSDSSASSSQPSSSSSVAEVLLLSTAGAEAVEVSTRATAGAATSAATEAAAAAAAAAAVKWEGLKAMMRQVRDLAGALSRANGKKYSEPSAGRREGGNGGREGGREEEGRVRCVSRATSTVGDWKTEEGRKNDSSSSSSSSSSNHNSGSDDDKRSKLEQGEGGREGGREGGEEEEEAGEGPIKRPRMDLPSPPYKTAGVKREDVVERLKEGLREIQERLKEAVREMEEMAPLSLPPSPPLSFQ